MNRHAIRAAFLLPCLLGVAACSFKTKWQDTTGQQRVQDTAQADARKCMDTSDYASLKEHHTTSELETFKAKMDICMAARGWKLVIDHG